MASKTKAALEGGLNVILCIGETLEVISRNPSNPTRSLLIEI